MQENIFIVLTSVEMIALCRLFDIYHFTFCMPMRFLPGNTHHIGAAGYNWSPRSMGKSLDTFHDAMVEIENNGEKFLNEDFMGAIFNGIVEDDEPLVTLVNFMNFMFGKLSFRLYIL